MRLSRSLVWVLACASAAVGLALVPMLAEADFLPNRGLWIALDLVIGAGFTGVGLYAWYRRPDNRVGALMVATGFAWYLVVAGSTPAALTWTVGTVASNLFVATAIHLLLAFPSGRLGTTADRALVGFAYAATTIGWLPAVLFMDSKELGCTACPENLLRIEGDSAFFEAWLDGLGLVGIAVMLSVVARLAQRWRSASGPLRRAVTPVFVAGGALLIALSTVLAVGQFEDFGAGVSMGILYACLIAFGLVPYLFLAGLVRGCWIRGQGVEALVRRLGHAPPAGGLRDELARALGDPSLELAYWLPESQRFVDADGREVALPAARPDRAVTDVEREGRRIAAIIHDPALLDNIEQVRAGASSETCMTAPSSASCRSHSAWRCSARGSTATPTRRAISTQRAASSTTRSRSCASWRAASIPRCSPIAVSRPLSTGWPSAPRCPSTWRR